MDPLLTLTSSDASFAWCLSVPTFKFLHVCLYQVSEGS